MKQKHEPKMNPIIGIIGITIVVAASIIELTTHHTNAAIGIILLIRLLMPLFMK